MPNASSPEALRRMQRQKRAGTKPELAVAGWFTPAVSGTGSTLRYPSRASDGGPISFSPRSRWPCSSTVATGTPVRSTARSPRRTPPGGPRSSTANVQRDRDTDDGWPSSAGRSSDLGARRPCCSADGSKRSPLVSSPSSYAKSSRPLRLPLRYSRSRRRWSPAVRHREHRGSTPRASPTSGSSAANASSLSTPVLRRITA